MKKLYLVREFYEDSDYTVGVCESEELAKALVDSTERKYSKPLSIDEDRWDEMIDSLTDEELDEYCKALHKNYPEYSIEEIEAADVRYNNYGYNGADYTTIHLYETLDDIYGNNN